MLSPPGAAGMLLLSFQKAAIASALPRLIKRRVKTPAAESLGLLTTPIGSDSFRDVA
jgi:hypothetical protein